MGWYDTITSGPISRQVSNELQVVWQSSSAPGTSFQIYLDRILKWSGPTLEARLPWPQEPVYVDVVAVDPGDEGVDYSSAFAALPSRRATLQWSGGRYLSGTIASFNIYMGLTPGGAVNYSKPVASIPWTSNNNLQDGAGIGGAGNGVAGLSEVRYSWGSKVLAPGTWNFAVVPVDAAGNGGTAATISQVIATGPTSPTNPTIAVNVSTHVPTLSWTP